MFLYELVIYQVTIILPLFMFLHLFFAVQTREHLFSVHNIDSFVVLFFFLSDVVNFNSVITSSIILFQNSFHITPINMLFVASKLFKVFPSFLGS